MYRSAGVPAAQMHGTGRMRLVVDKLTCRRGDRVIFSDLSFALSEGEAVMLTGPNGAGKTTLLRVIAGLMPPAGGHVLLDGDDAAVAPERCHYVGHRDGIRLSLTAGENIDFWCRYLGGEPNAAATALDRLGIGTLEDVPAAYLSAGQRRRLGLARLLAAPRAIWLLDEPTTSLDAQAQATLAALMAAHRAGGGIVVAATHAPLGLDAVREIALGRRPVA
jgi:heme exporter protein A